MTDLDRHLATLQRSEVKHQRSIFGAIAALFSRNGRAEIVPVEQHSRATVARYTQRESASRDTHIVDM
jgi:hypothetical protein